MLSGGCRELVSCSPKACSSSSAGPLHSWIKSNPTVTLVDAYIIGPADVLDLKLFDAEELSGALEVLNDGSVPLPLVGSGQYLGDRYHHHPAAERIFLPGGDCGSVLQKRAQLGSSGAA